MRSMRRVDEVEEVGRSALSADLSTRAMPNSAGQGSGIPWRAVVVIAGVIGVLAGGQVWSTWPRGGEAKQLAATPPESTQDVLELRPMEPAETPPVGTSDAQGAEGGTISDAAAVQTSQFATELFLQDVDLSGGRILRAGLPLPNGSNAPVRIEAIDLESLQVEGLGGDIVCSQEEVSFLVDRWKGVPVPPGGSLLGVTLRTGPKVSCRGEVLRARLTITVIEG